VCGAIVLSALDLRAVLVPAAALVCWLLLTQLERLRLQRFA
jgi:hypothetical protein